MSSALGRLRGSTKVIVIHAFAGLLAVSLTILPDIACIFSTSGRGRERFTSRVLRIHDREKFVKASMI